MSEIFSDIVFQKSLYASSWNLYGEANKLQRIYRWLRLCGKDNNKMYRSSQTIPFLVTPGIRPQRNGQLLSFNPSVLTERQTRGSNRDTGCALLTLISDCAVHRVHRTKWYRHNLRAAIFIFVDIEDYFLNWYCY